MTLSVTVSVALTHSRDLTVNLHVTSTMEAAVTMRCVCRAEYTASGPPVHSLYTASLKQVRELFSILCVM